MLQHETFMNLPPLTFNGSNLGGDFTVDWPWGDVGGGPEGGGT